MVRWCWVNFHCRGVLSIYLSILSIYLSVWGWSGGAMVLGTLPVPGRPTIWITVGQGGCLDIFTLIYPVSPLSPSLWETVRYRLKYCLKGPLNPKQPTNQNLSIKFCSKLFSQRPINSSQNYSANDNLRQQDVTVQIF